MQSNGCQIAVKCSVRSCSQVVSTRQQRFRQENLVKCLVLILDWVVWAIFEFRRVPDVERLPNTRTECADFVKSAVIAAPSFTFTNDPLTSQVTPAKAIHINELRQAINALRTRNRLSTFNFTNPTLTAGVTQIQAVHGADMRTALNGVYDAL